VVRDPLDFRIEVSQFKDLVSPQSDARERDSLDVRNDVTYSKDTESPIFLELQFIKISISTHNIPNYPAIFVIINNSLQPSVIIN